VWAIFGGVEHARASLKFKVRLEYGFPYFQAQQVNQLQSQPSRNLTIVVQQAVLHKNHVVLAVLRFWSHDKG
jgi:hypothetical protein